VLLCAQSDGVSPAVSKLVPVESQYHQLAAALDTTRHHMPTKGFYLPADGKQEYLGEMPVIMISALLLLLWLLFHCRQFSTHGSYGQEKSGKMERVRESQGILKVSHCKKIKTCSK